MRCLSIYLLLALPALMTAAEEQAGDYVPKPPPQEFKLALILLDQGKYEDAVRHFRYIVKYFEVEEPKNSREEFLQTVAQLHIEAFKLKQVCENGQCPPEQKKRVETWVEALFPRQPAAAGEGIAEAVTGKFAIVHNIVEVRRLVKDEEYSGALAVGNISSAAAKLLLQWVQAGHRLLLQDATAALFGFRVAPIPPTSNPRVTQDRRAVEHRLLEGVKADTLVFGGAGRGWCVTAHPYAKPLLTARVSLGRGRPTVPVAVCAVVKSGRGDVVFCNSQLDSEVGDGGVLYRNLALFMQTFPGSRQKEENKK